MTNAQLIEVAEAPARHGSAVTDDLRQLWRRMAFSVALNNTDGHLRNIGFRSASPSTGWTLSPIFDVNPNPDHGAAPATSVNFAHRPDGVRHGCSRLRRTSISTPAPRQQSSKR